MTDTVIVEYYDGAQWVTWVDGLTALHVDIENLSRVSTATLNYLTTRNEAINTFLASPYKQFRIKVTPTGYSAYNMFYGYLAQPFMKSLAGQLGSKVKISLDLTGVASALASN